MSTLDRSIELLDRAITFGEEASRNFEHTSELTYFYMDIIIQMLELLPAEEAVHFREEILAKEVSFIAKLGAEQRRKESGRK